MDLCTTSFEHYKILQNSLAGQCNEGWMDRRMDGWMDAIVMDNSRRQMGRWMGGGWMESDENGWMDGRFVNW